MPEVRSRPSGYHDWKQINQRRTMPEAFIVDAARTPIVRAVKALRKMSAR